MKRFLLLLTMLAFAVCPIMEAEDVSSLIFNNQIAIGMSYGNVVASWGKPDKVDRDVASYGVTEYWFFRGRGYMVVFRDGRVSSFSQY